MINGERVREREANKHIEKKGRERHRIEKLKNSVLIDFYRLVMFKLVFIWSLYYKVFGVMLENTCLQSKSRFVTEDYFVQHNITIKKV
jgi:hypothetical protein